MPKTSKVMPAEWKADMDTARQIKYGRSLAGKGPTAPTYVSGGVQDDVYYVEIDGQVLESSKTPSIHLALATSRVEYLRCSRTCKIQVRRESDGAILAVSSFANLQHIEKD